MNMKMKRILGICLIASMILASSCSKGPEYIQITGQAQGGTYSVKMNISGVKASREAIRDSIDSILTLIDTTLSGYNKKSILSRRNAGEDVPTNAMFDSILMKSKEYFDVTGGALDVAAGPLFDAWGFGFTTDSLPSQEKIDSLLSVCGMRHLGESHQKLNFNAIAQGYSADVVASYLHSIGVKDMLVDIGEIYCEGLNPNGKPWTIAIDRPVDGNNVPGQNTDGIWQGNGSGCGIVTSGNYRKFYEKDGKKYSHTIDPRTGYPVSHNLLSATIVAPNATDADAFATYCMVIGLEESKKFIESRPDLEGYLIYDDKGTMTEWASPGFNLIGK
jgi:thiamine biosynthesis lipoprotein